MIPVVAFDTETTGVDVETDRIVEAAVVVLRPDGTESARRTWLINPGIPIPEEAAAVHGITTERVRAEGLDPAVAIAEIAEMVERASNRGLPLVVYNAPFDLTLLDREIRRHECSPFVGDIGGNDLGIWWEPRPVLDPLVLDKQIDRYRKGKRTLEAVAAHYGVEFEGSAHGAYADAITSGRVMQRMTFHVKHPLAGQNVLAASAGALSAVHDSQIGWKREQSAGLEAHFARQYYSNPYEHGEPPTVDGSWPYRSDRPHDGRINPLEPEDEP